MTEMLEFFLNRTFYSCFILVCCTSIFTSLVSGGHFLSFSAPSTSTYIPRLQREQTKIESLLLERGVDDLRDGMEQTSINGDAEAHTSMNSQASPSLVNSPMSVTSSTQIPGPVVSQDVRPPSPQPILAKQRALAKFVSLHFLCFSFDGNCTTKVADDVVTITGGEERKLA